MSDKQELSSAKIEQGWRDTFSTENPFCPCNLKSFTKAVRWAERAMLQAAPAEPAMHASAPTGMKCADCYMDKEACPTCYSAWWKARHPHSQQMPEGAPPAPVAATGFDREYVRAYLEELLIDKIGNPHTDPEVSKFLEWLAAPVAHSKSEYKRRVAMGDANVLPPAVQPAPVFCEYCGGNDDDPPDHCMDCTRPGNTPVCSSCGGAGCQDCAPEASPSPAPVAAPVVTDAQFYEWAEREGYGQSMLRTHAKAGWDAAILAAQSGAGTTPLPAHLQDDAPALKCDQCGRKSWDVSQRGRFCNMPQPSNRLCSGIMQSTGAPQ